MLFGSMCQHFYDVIFRVKLQELWNGVWRTGDTGSKFGVQTKIGTWIWLLWGLCSSSIIGITQKPDLAFGVLQRDVDIDRRGNKERICML